MKFVLPILGALLLVQLAYPLPAADSSSSSSSEEDTPSESYLTQAFNLLLDFYTKSLKGYTQIFQNVVDKASHVETQSVALQKYLARFDQYISDVKNITESENKPAKLVDVIRVIEETSEFSDMYKKAGADDPEAFPEELHLDQNGLRDFRKKVVDDFEKFEPKFREMLDAYAAGLTAEVAKKDYRFVVWFNEYKKINENKRKLGLLFDFASIYD